MKNLQLDMIIQFKFKIKLGRLYSVVRIIKNKIHH